MRISDWGSDVCSSDLRLVAVAVEQVLHVPEVVRADPRAVPGAGGELPDGALQRQEGAQPLSVGRRGIGPVGADVVPALRQALVGIAVLDDEAENARSEEHTSELQSLMRISYAVFCLLQNKKVTYD